MQTSRRYIGWSISPEARLSGTGSMVCSASSCRRVPAPCGIISYRARRSPLSPSSSPPPRPAPSVTRRLPGQVSVVNHGIPWSASRVRLICCLLTAAQSAGSRLVRPVFTFDAHALPVPIVDSGDILEQQRCSGRACDVALGTHRALSYVRNATCSASPSASPPPPLAI